MSNQLRLPLLILWVGALVTLVHEYFYARLGDGDWELFGLLSHGGIDMVIGSVVSATFVLVYTTRKART